MTVLVLLPFNMLRLTIALPVIIYHTSFNAVYRIV